MSESPPKAVPSSGEIVSIDRDTLVDAIQSAWTNHPDGTDALELLDFDALWRTLRSASNETLPNVSPIDVVRECETAFTDHADDHPFDSMLRDATHVEAVKWACGWTLRRLGQHVIKYDDLAVTLTPESESEKPAEVDEKRFHRRVDELLAGWSMLHMHGFTEDQFNSLVDMLGDDFKAQAAKIHAHGVRVGKELAKLKGGGK